MGKGDYKKKVAEWSYFPAFEKLMGGVLTGYDKTQLLKLTFDQLHMIGLMLAMTKGQDWYKVIAEVQRHESETNKSVESV